MIAWVDLDQDSSKYLLNRDLPNVCKQITFKYICVYANVNKFGHAREINDIYHKSIPAIAISMYTHPSHGYP